MALLWFPRISSSSYCIGPRLHSSSGSHSASLAGRRVGTQYDLGDQSYCIRVLSTRAGITLSGIPPKVPRNGSSSASGQLIPMLARHTDLANKNTILSGHATAQSETGVSASSTFSFAPSLHRFALRTLGRFCGQIQRQGSCTQV